MRAPILAAALAICAAFAAPAQEVPTTPDPGAPDGAVITAHSDRPYDRYELPIGSYSGNVANSRAIDGRVIWSSFRLDASDVSTAEVMAGYRARLSALDFDPIFDCATAGCGGFDFRFAVQLLPAPAMLIDTADFAQFSASRPAGPGLDGNATTYVSVLVSRVLGAVYIQTVLIEPGNPGRAIAAAPEPDAAAQPVILAQDEESLIERLTQFGHVPVQGLVFETGGAALSASSASALETLAQLLSRNPALAVVIVGHSDNQGGLDANIALSKRRAEAVLMALVDRGVAAARLEAHGAGYLAPVTTNATEDGRTLNRRVELVLR
ncbi:MAG TPA: OmpA family protein [Thermohalobaculum sp.]|nr:OmpA family protein [Thermohalobaculum sp.]